MPNINDINGVTVANLAKVDAVLKANIWKVNGLELSAFTGLLDTYTGAAAGYSTRRLASSATVLMRVRRNTVVGAGDDDEADVAYDSNNEISLNSAISNASAGVTATTLGEFLNVGTVGGTTYTNADSLSVTASCFVDEWKDQSGNGNHATQGTFGSQPQIHSGTVNTDLITKNGKPALSYNKSSSTHLSFATSALNGKYPDLFMVLSVDSYSQFGSSTLSQTTSGNYYTQVGAGTNFYVQGSSAAGTGIAVNDGQQRLIEQYADGTDIFTVYDGVSYSATTSTSAYPSGTLTYRIGKHSTTDWNLGGQLQEYIIWPDNQTSTNRTGITTNINGYFSIY